MKKIIALILCLVMCIPMFVACDGDEPADTTKGAAASTTAPQGGVTTDPVDVSHDYDDVAKKDWGGYTFNVLSSGISGGEKKRDFLCESPNGDLRNDLVYARNAKIEKDYNIIIESKTGINVGSTIQAQFTAGWTEGDFDLYGWAGRQFLPLSTTGCMANLANYEELDIYNDHWDQKFVDMFTIHDSLYALSGNISVSINTAVQVLCFNKTLFRETGREEPYDLVRNKQWYVQNLLDYMEGFAQDKDKDGYDWDKDLYGITGWGAEAGYGLFTSSGFTFVQNDGEKLVLDIDTDYLDELTDAIIAVWCQNGTLIDFSGSPDRHHMPHQVFSDGRGLFCDIIASKIAAFFSDMADDYGILPEPMLNDKQKDYCSYVGAYTSIYGISSHDPNSERTGNIMEALCAANTDMVIPKMFEIVTKVQNARDEDSAEMFDIAIKNKVFDPADWLKIEGISAYPEDIIAEGRNIMQQYLGLYERKAGTSVENFVSGIERLQK